MEKPYFCPRYKDKEMKTLVACLILALLLSGCRGKDRPVAEPDEPQSRADTLAAVDAAVNDADEPSDAVDRLFDDFIYTFMRDRTFQLKRISFPLSNRVDGVDRPIERKQWKFDPLYAHSDFYTMIFDSERAVSREKDPKLDHVEVEWIYLNRGRVKQYIFRKQSGKWMLVGLNTSARMPIATSTSSITALLPTPTSSWPTSKTPLNFARSTPIIFRKSTVCSMWPSGPTIAPHFPATS